MKNKKVRTLIERRDAQITEQYRSVTDAKRYSRQHLERVQQAAMLHREQPQTFGGHSID